jgi:hypothetical protein
VIFSIVVSSIGLVPLVGAAEPASTSVRKDRRVSVEDRGPAPTWGHDREGALSAPSQLALTLRAVGGLTTAEIAAAFLVPESTMAQRISRAKQRLRGERFGLPAPADLPARLQVVERVLYLVFNEGTRRRPGPTCNPPS